MKRLRSDIFYTFYSLFFTMACGKTTPENQSLIKALWPNFPYVTGEVDEWLNFTCAFCWLCVRPWLHACLPARRLNGRSSAYCWDSGLILLHPHHGLALTHPWSLFTHWLFCPLPPTASPDRILPLSRHRTQASKQTGSRSCALYMHSMSDTWKVYRKL